MIVELESLEVVLKTGKDPVKILDIPQWKVEEAEQVAIFGPSGSGKSTFLYALAGLMPVTSGKINVCDHPLEEMSEA